MGQQTPSNESRWQKRQKFLLVKIFGYYMILYMLYLIFPIDQSPAIV